MEIKGQKDAVIIRTCMYCKKNFGCVDIDSQNACLTCTLKKCLIEIINQHNMSHGICEDCAPEALRLALVMI